MRALVALVVALLAAPLAIGSPVGADPLPLPSPVTPVPGATTTTNPELSWTPVLGAVSYHVQVSTSPTFVGVIPILDDVVVNTTVTPVNDLPLGAVYWRVAPVPAVGFESPMPATPWSFTKVAAAAPTPSAPADAATVDLATGPVTLSWTAVAGTDHYVVDVDDASDFSSPTTQFTDETTLVLGQPPTLPTTPGGPAPVAYWRVRAVSPIGNVTPYSPARSFTTVWSAVPTPTFPPDTTSPTIEEVVLAWGAVPGATTYEVAISADSFATTLSSVVVSSTRYSPASTLLDGTYQWRVRGRNYAGGSTAWSPMRTFTRAWPSSVPPTQSPVPDWSASTSVSLVAPADGATVNQPVFTWTPMRLASSYEVQIGQNPAFPGGSYGTCTTDRPVLTLDASTLSGDGCTISLFPATTYYWRVRPRDVTAGGFTVQIGPPSAVRSFQYGIGAPTGVTVTMDGGAPWIAWDVPTDDIGHWKVYVTEVGGAALTPVDTYQPRLVPFGLKPSKLYSFSVRAVDAGGRQGPLTGGTFTTGALPATVAPGATIGFTTGPTPAATAWDGVIGATRYEVWYRPAGAGSWTVAATPSPITFPSYVHAAGDLTAGSWELQVHAFDGGGTELAASAVAGFTVDPLVAPTRTAPADCPPGNPCAAVGETPTFTWLRPAGGAERYVVTLASDPAFATVLATFTTQGTQVALQRSLPDNATNAASYWWVQACTGSVCSSAPPVGGQTPSAFQKHSPAVEQIFPAAGATVASPPTLAWADYLRTNQSPPSVGTAPTSQEARAYKVRIAADPAGTTVLDEATVDQTTYTPPFVLLAPATVYWAVAAVDGTGNQLPWSTFRPVTLTEAAVSLTAPASGAAVDRFPTFTWAAVPGAYRYEIEVYRNPDQPLGAGNLVAGTTNAFQPGFSPTALLPVGTYGWRVRWVDGAGNPRAWSALDNTGLRTFTVGRDAPVPASPTGGSFVASDRVVLRWSATPDATRYRVELATTADFAAPLLTPAPEPAQLAYAVPDAVPAGTWFWRVTALDGVGTTLATSSTATFVTDRQGGAFHALTPYRVLDSRTNIGGFNGFLGAGDTKTLLVGDGVVGHVPASATAVVLNVTATNATAPSFFTLYPTGAPRPGTASLLFGASQTVPNLVTVALGQGGTDGANIGKVDFFNQQGAAHVIADVVGYYDSGSDPQGSLFNGITPVRVLDSRGPVGGWNSQKLGPNASRDVPIAGQFGIPPTATGVVMNVTATGGSANSFLTVYPAGGTNPGTASLLYGANQTVPNLVVVGLGTTGSSTGNVTVFNQQGSVDVIADAVGYFDPTDGARFHPITPVRALDSRTGIGGLSGPWGAGSARTLALAGVAGSGVPTGATGVVANVTATSGTAASFLTLYPAGVANPGTANLLFGISQTIPNAVYVQTGSGGAPTLGKVTIFNQQGQVQVIMDVAGYFAPH